jgi:hypothetical protein
VGPCPEDRISRIVMLVLAGMVTLSVVGVIEAIPRGAMQERVGLERPRQQQPVPQERQPPEPQPEQTQQPQPDSESDGISGGGAVGPAAPAPAPTEDEDVERWLEAITYALMALVGLLAISTIILWRSLRERRRIADSLEAFSSSQPT